MLCAISGEAPQHPVVSRKSGNVYEKRLIASYITENGTEPTTGESLTVDDLLDIQTSQSVRPRPPTLTSIPALLGVFQEEWDALALETFTLQQNLAQARQELSTALYQNDAAIRVIARLTRERDEAREALGKVQVGGIATNGSNGDAMQVDNTPLPDSIIAKIDSTQEKLMKTRRKRPVPTGWATADEVASYKPTTTSPPLFPGAKFMSVDDSGDLVLLGGVDGAAAAYSISEARVAQSWAGDGTPITSGIWSGSRAIVSTQQGKVTIYDGQSEAGSFRVHSAAVTSLTLHPSGDIFASVSDDKSYALYDAQSSAVMSQVFTDSALSCAQFHPDGHLIALGGKDGQIKFYDVRSGSLAGVFDTGAALKAVYFSENGTWVAAANTSSSAVSIWDLRKVGQANDPIKVIETGSAVESLNWDYTAQFLLIGGAGGISVEQYTKSNKAWTEPLKVALPVSAVAWGAAARQIFSIDSQGVLSILSG